ncbi:MAG: hypothetical protein A4E62_00397 [Syntrophorhabdus sp. PtaU1.Bin002]|nr:MAG: hypothetical protein A4E62_00397 [Syntrophorhabdus sp. PtaU1.Bin002]
MPMAIINGRRVDVPSTATDDDIRRAGGIRDDRTLIKRERHGNFVIPRGSRANVAEGDVFVDSPKRIKG